MSASASKNQLTSGSGVGIYQEAPVNYCRNTRIRAIPAAAVPLPVAAVPLPVNLPINSSHQNLSLAIKISPNFEKIDSGRRPLATTFGYFESFNSHEI